MWADAKVYNLIRQRLKLAIFIENYFPLLEKTHDPPETCNFVASEAFDRVPVQVVKTMLSLADPFEVSF